VCVAALWTQLEGQEIEAGRAAAQSSFQEASEALMAQQRLITDREV
jgi:hypothetical protein